MRLLRALASVLPSSVIAVLFTLLGLVSRAHSIGPTPDADAVDGIEATSDGPPRLVAVYTGNPSVNGTRAPASVNPAKATLFALHSSRFGRGILHMLRSSKVPLENPNVLAGIEEEIPAAVSPTEFAELSEVTISASRAKSILHEMGIDLPETVSRGGLTPALEDIPVMTREQVVEFVRRAQAAARSAEQGAASGTAP